MQNIRRIAVKEFFGMFASLTAPGFLFAFLAIVLIVFFWVDPFFARNSADLRPIFEAMPMLLVFFCSALTMKMWSEERRSGTVEFLLTLPLSNLELVIGKFIACLFLVFLALSLTLSIPLSVFFIAGPLDWGPTIGGYVASLFLAAAYLAIGLSISARTENQFVSFLLSVAVCFALLIVGAPFLGQLFPIYISEIMALIGSGSRFQSITRGVIDLRDLYYYFSVTCVFLILNAFNLEKIRWANNRSNSNHRKWVIISSLAIANFLLANVWLHDIAFARIDLTEGKIYTLSNATHRYLKSLKEPLLIRGYFSQRSHPMLQSVTPRLKDLLKEYQAIAPKKITLEFLDPSSNPQIEKEALENYGVRPSTFDSASRNRSSVVNAYFDVVLTYGGESKKLNWQDLLEVSTKGNSLKADLRNPEYDITSAIKKLVNQYQGSGDSLDNLEKPIKFVGFVSSNQHLPAFLAQLRIKLTNILDEFSDQSNGKFSYEFIDPGMPDGPLAQKILNQYGYGPMSLKASDSAKFFFYMSLTDGSRLVQIPLDNPVTTDGLKGKVKAGLKKFDRRMVKTIGVYQGLNQNLNQQNLLSHSPSDTYTLLAKRLADEYLVQNVRLETDEVPADVDLMVLLAAEGISEKQLFALDQFLMRGGKIVFAISPFVVNMEKNLSCRESGNVLLAWLKSYGLEVQKSMVLDTENLSPLMPTNRLVNKTHVAEKSIAPYPYFVDVSKESLKSSEITSGMTQLPFTWCSPIIINRQLNRERTVCELFKSSAKAWTSIASDLNPHYTDEAPLGFEVGKDVGTKLLACSIEGRFDSYFNGKIKPVASEKKAVSAEHSKEVDSIETPLRKSPESSKIIVFSSNTFLTDKVIYLMSSIMGRFVLEPIDLVQNSIDWSFNDRELLAVRGRANYARALYLLTPQLETLFECTNYAIPFLGLVCLIFIVKFASRLQKEKLEKFVIPESLSAYEVSR